MANYTYNKIVCSEVFFNNYLMDDDPFGDKAVNDSRAGWVTSSLITFNKLFDSESIDDYLDKTQCTSIDYSAEIKICSLENGMVEVYFETRWYYPIKAIIKSLNIEKEKLVWYVVEENEIYVSKFYWSAGKVNEDTLYIENVDEYVEWYIPYWAEIDEFSDPSCTDYWIFDYRPETRTGWINWPSSDIISRYLKYYPCGEYYEQIRGRK